MTGDGDESNGFSATYSPQDNKLRLYADSRLEAGLYERVKEAGFRWASKQDLFVAPKWTPEREDLLMELCGGIDDEDIALVDRAQERAFRFDGYSDSRAEDAQTAHSAVSAITQHIPFGQPILVGHHSERHARKHAEQITNGMRKAVQMWETSEYWKQRAASAIGHAKYKERADVRARRIKILEAEMRAKRRIQTEAEEYRKAWQTDNLSLKVAMQIANGSYYSQCYPLKDYPRDEPASQYEGQMGFWSALESGIITPLQAQAIALPHYEQVIARVSRWILHYENRLIYERAMLDEQGGTKAEQTKPEKGGAVRCWVGRGSWVFIQKVNKVSVTLLDNWGNGGKNFTRTIPFDKLEGLMSAAQVAQARTDGLLVELEDHTGFRLRVAPTDEIKEETSAERNQRMHQEHMAATAESPASTASAAPTAQDFQAIKEQLRQGVQIVSAPQLFPTPPSLAARMVQLADFRELGLRVLEPSAGTGSILRALPGVIPFPMVGGRQTACDVVAVEINHGLASALAQSGLASTVKCADFLQCNGDLGQFDRILMNPPFANGQDIKHIRHAATMLKPGGRLVAICANGPRQNDQLRPWVEQQGGQWHPLPAGTFVVSGTCVNAVLISLEG